MNEILFSDTYQGPRWTYGLTYRPVASAHLPKGWIVFSARKHPDFAHGTVDFPKQLTETEISGFQLSLVEVKQAD